MELRRYLSILRRRIALIIVTVAVAAAAGFVATPRTPTYSATSVIYVGPRQYVFGQNQPPNNSDALATANGVLATFSKMIASQPIAADAVSSTGVDRPAAEVVGETSVTIEANTQLLDVKVTDGDASVAQQLANGVSDAFVAKVQSFQSGTPAQPGTAPSLPAYVFERAGPGAPQSSGLLRNMGLGALLGLLASAGLAFLLEYMDVTIKGAGDAERQLNLPVLGVIPFERGSARA